MKTPFSVSQLTSLPLINDGQLKVTCLGTGSMLSSGNNTAYLAVKGNEHLLIDCGRTVPDSLRAFGVNWAEVENVLLTHTHGDHIGGFTTIATANRYIGVPQGTEKLSLVAPKPFARVLWDNCFSGDLGTHVTAGDPGLTLTSHWYDIAEPAFTPTADRDIYEIDFKGMHLEIFRTMHTPGGAKSWRDSAWSTGVLIDGKIWISGDSIYDPDLLKHYADRADVFIHDMSSYQNAVHAWPDDFLAEPVNLKGKMYSTHHDAGFTSATLADKGFAGMAMPGMTFTFEKSETKARISLPGSRVAMLV